MRYRALGPLTVEIDGRAAKLGGLRQQMVLAILLSNANQVVPQDRLIDSVWAGNPPEAARATVQSYIYGLRQVLGAEAIIRRGDGYIIEVDRVTFDVLAFEESVKRGRALLGSDPEAARTALVEGLGMWFGTAYGGVDHPELYAEIQRLGELRVNAIESRIDADLALGGGGELVSELETVVRDYPLRERFWAQLMLALYRSGRQAEALRAFQHARSKLVDELGIEPGAELQRLEEQILNQDPSLLTEPSSAPQAQAIRGYELREPIEEGDFGVVYRAYQPSVGREVAVKAIRAELANDPDFVKRFEREAQIVANLEHPHIVPLYDYWRDPDGAYLVMPLMRGGSLAEALQRGGWRLEPTLRLLDQVGGALAYAHRRDVLHRDLKPGNIILDEDGNAYLSDFGIAARPTADGDVPLNSSRGFVPPEEVAGEQHTIRSDVFGLGALTFNILTGLAPPATLPLPDLVEARPGTSAELAEVVARATAMDPGERFGRVEDFLRDLRRSAGVDVIAASDLASPTAEPTRNPYKGLRAFTEDDAVDFYGRAALVDDLLEKVATHRLVTVVGPSGSGKSSVVRAGLLPALRAGGVPGSRDWLVTDMFPGSYPFEELEAALTRVAVDSPSGLLTELTEPHGLLRVAKQILPGDDSTLLILIDQFEELFSTVRSEDIRRRFLDNLIAVASDERSRVRVVLTMRADFLDRPLGYGDFAEVIADGVVTVGPPTRDGLAQAMAAPARTVGLELEPGLVGRITGDVLGEPGALPLLQYALSEMFSRREGPVLTIAAYEATGGVAGALGRRAEELYDGLGPSGQEAARQVFLRLVSVDEFAADTRRRARQSELLSLAVDRAGVESVLNAFAGFRLLTFDRDPVTRGPTVEVAHEALFTEWGRLRGWIDDARDSLILARRVRESAQEWIESDRDPSYLLRGTRLDEVENWTSDPEVVLTVGESEFIEASIDNREEERAAARRRRRRTIMALAAGLAVVSVLAVVAFIQRGVAEREALQARVRELAEISGSQLEENQELALLIAAEAFDVSVEGLGEPLPQTVSALASAAHDWRLAGRFPAGNERIAEASPDGSLVATSVGEYSHLVNVFHDDGSPVTTLEGPDHPDVSARAAVFHPDGDKIAVVYVTLEGGGYQPAPEGVPDVVVFDAVSGSVLSQIELDEVTALWISFGPSGEMLGVSSRREVRIVDWEQGAETGRFERSSNVGRVTFLDSETVLVPVDGSGLAKYSIADGSLVEQLDDPDINYLVTAADAGGSRYGYVAGDRIRVMDIDTGEVVFEREAAPGVVALALNPGGTRLAYAGYDPNIYVVPLAGEGDALTLTGSYGNVVSLRFIGPDRLLSHGSDALMWDVSPEAVEALGGVRLAEPPSWGYQISADGNLLAYSQTSHQQDTDSGDGFRLVDVETQQQILKRDGELMNVDVGLRWVSPDFTMVGSLTVDGRSTVRRLPSWEVVREFEACRSPVAFTPDDSHVLLTGWVCGAEVPDDVSTRSEVIDLESGEATFSLPSRSIYEASFNPEGIYPAGRYLVISDQESVQLWDVRAGVSIGRLDASELDGAGILAVNFDPTGRYVVGGTAGGVVWVLDIERVIAGAEMVDALVFSRQAHTGAAPAPAVSADGIVGSAGFADGAVRLWDLDSGDLLLELEAEMGGAPLVRFTSDGSHLLYPHGASVRRVPVDPYELRALAGNLLTRDFLPDECAQYARPERCEALDVAGAGPSREDSPTG